MKVLESKQCVYGIKKLIKNKDHYLVVIFRLDKNLKKTIKKRVFKYEYFGEAFLRYNDGNYNMVRKYSL